jgi:hypothetical protein
MKIARRIVNNKALDRYRAFEMNAACLEDPRMPEKVVPYLRAGVAAQAQSASAMAPSTMFPK